MNEKQIKLANDWKQEWIKSIDDSFEEFNARPNLTVAQRWRLKQRAKAERAYYNQIRVEDAFKIYSYEFEKYQEMRIYQERIDALESDVDMNEETRQKGLALFRESVAEVKAKVPIAVDELGRSLLEA